MNFNGFGIKKGGDSVRKLGLFSLSLAFLLSVSMGGCITLPLKVNDDLNDAYKMEMVVMSLSYLYRLETHRWPENIRDLDLFSDSHHFKIGDTDLSVKWDENSDWKAFLSQSVANNNLRLSQGKNSSLKIDYQNPETKMKLELEMNVDGKLVGATARDPRGIVK